MYNMKNFDFKTDPYEILTVVIIHVDLYISNFKKCHVFLKKPLNQFSATSLISYHFVEPIVSQACLGV